MKDMRYEGQRQIVVSPGDVINNSLDDVKVATTPTLLLVDQSGHVKSAWVGKLDENREKEVIQRALNPH